VGTIQEIERKIAARIVDDALAAGYTVEVFDGEELVLKDSRDREAILAAMFSTDEDTLFFHSLDDKKGRVVSGFVRLVYGNTGWDVISDASGNSAMADLLAGAEKLAEQISRDEESAAERAATTIASLMAGGA
jgi:hypothetical protein